MEGTLEGQATATSSTTPEESSGEVVEGGLVTLEVLMESIRGMISNEIKPLKDDIQVLKGRQAVVPTIGTPGVVDTTTPRVRFAAPRPPAAPNPGRGSGVAGGQARGGRGRGRTSIPTPRVAYGQEEPLEGGSGTTRRTAFRKARKGIKVSWNSTEWPALRSALAALARLQLRWGTSSEASLGPLVNLESLGLTLEVIYTWVLGEVSIGDNVDLLEDPWLHGIPEDD